MAYTNKTLKEKEQNVINEKNALANYGEWSYDKNLEAKKNNALNKYTDRGPFTYDVNSDPLFQQYKDQYTTQGKMAMMDTVGQAATLTGGYANSYAQTAGQQAYQGYLQQLNAVVPELYQMAYDRYNQEGQDLLNQYYLIADDEANRYSKWESGRNQIIADIDRATNDYLNTYNLEYGWHSDKKTDARETAYAAIQAGIVPSDALLSEAGLNKADVTALANSYKTNAGADAARDLVYASIQAGVTPSDASLAAAGMNKADVTALANAYKTNAGADSAREFVYASIQAGIVPSDASLAAAGLDKADATALANAYKANVNATGGLGLKGDKPNNEAEDDDIDKYNSDFRQTTGNYRFNEPGTLFNNQQFRGFQQAVTMCRSTEGRCAMIDDAIVEGKITDYQANALLENYGISDEEFMRIRGING